MTTRRGRPLGQSPVAGPYYTQPGPSPTMAPTLPQIPSGAFPQPVPIPAPPGLEGIWEHLPPDQQHALASAWNAYAPPAPPSMSPVDTQPHGMMEQLGTGLGAHPFAMPTGYHRGGFLGALATGLATGMGNYYAGRGANSYTQRVGQAQADQQAKQTAYAAQAAEAKAGRSMVAQRALTVATEKPTKPEDFYPPAASDLQYMRSKGAMGPELEADLAANNGKFSTPAYRSFQAAVDNQRAGDRANTAASSVRANASQADLSARADKILEGIRRGDLDPDVTHYGTNRDGLRGLISARAVDLGVNLGQLQQDWQGKIKNIGVENSAPQKRMHQAALAIPLLLDQMAGKVGPDGQRHGGLLERLPDTGFQPLNVPVQGGRKAIGQGGDIRSWNVLRAKLATEQSVLINGGNKPDVHTVQHFTNEYDPTIPHADLRKSVMTSEQSVQAYKGAIQNAGAVTPSSPYGSSNVQLGGAQYPLGANPPAGTVQPTVKMRAPGPNGKVTDVPSSLVEHYKSKGAIVVGGR